MKPISRRTGQGAAENEAGCELRPLLARLLRSYRGPLPVAKGTDRWHRAAVDRSIGH
jgi:hypothetical protein